MCREFRALSPMYYFHGYKRRAQNEEKTEQTEINGELRKTGKHLQRIDSVPDFLSSTFVFSLIEIGSKFDPELRLHSRVEGMLDLLHLGHEIGQFHHFRQRAATGDNHVQVGPFRPQGREDFFLRQILH